MKKVAVSQVPEVERRSPSGKFRVFSRNVTLALGAPRDVGPWGGGFPFDVDLHRIPPGAANFPYHTHAAQWELYCVVSGRGQVRHAAGVEEVAAGDAFVFPPGEAHQIRNPGPDDLVLQVIADNPQADVFTYPDSGKVGFKPGRKFFRAGSEADYYEGEDP